MTDLFSEKDIAPMLLGEDREPFDDPDWIFELKLDGIRCIAYLEPGRTTLRNKRNREVTDLYPELSDLWKCAEKRCILDGELVAFTDGKPDFYALQRRSLMTDSFRIGISARRQPVRYVCYDILYAGSRQVTQLALTERKALLSETVREGNGLSVSRAVEGQGRALFARTEAEGLEGIVAKRKDGRYHIGRRTRDWIKIKVMQDEDVRLCGYEPDGAGGIRALVLGAEGEDGLLRPCGKVSLGISKSDRKSIVQFAEDHPAVCPWPGKERGVIWMEPELVGTVHYMQKTRSGTLRQPVFKGIRRD